MIFKKNLKSVLIIVILIAIMIFILFPIFYSFIYSGFNEYEENKTNNNQLWPQKWKWKNYEIAFKSGYWNALFFSFVLALLLVFFRLFFCGAAGYALAKKDLKHNRIIMVLFAFLSMIPENSLYLGLLTRINQWHLNQSIFLFIGLTAPNIFSLFTILIFQDAFANISEDEKKLIKIDKLNFWQKISIIFWPKLKHAFIFTTIITTSAAWNSYLWPMILLPSNKHTLSTFVFSLGNLEDGSISYSIKLAGVVLYTLPVIVFYAIFHQKIAKSFSKL